MAIALHMVGARLVKEGTGRIARFELVPLGELGGRPRVDVLCNMSGIFRDSFQNVVELLDDCFQVCGGWKRYCRRYRCCHLRTCRLPVEVQ